MELLQQCGNVVIIALTVCITLGLAVCFLWLVGIFWAMLDEGF